MASLRFRTGKWQVQIRRPGYAPRAKSFQSKSDAQRWARQTEAELDRTLIPNDVRSLSAITVAQILTHYRDTITGEKRGLAPELKRPASIAPAGRIAIRSLPGSEKGRRGDH